MKSEDGSVSATSVVLVYAGTASDAAEEGNCSASVSVLCDVGLPAVVFGGSTVPIALAGCSRLPWTAARGRSVWGVFGPAEQAGMQSTAMRALHAAILLAGPGDNNNSRSGCDGFGISVELSISV